MAVDLIVQDDEGDVADANAYITRAFFETYHTRRGNNFSTYTTDQKLAAIIRASDYLDTRFNFIGVKTNNGTLATGTLTASVNVTADQTVTIDSDVWTFKSPVTSGNEVLIGATLADSLSNLADAINGDGTPGTEYAVGNVPSTVVTASATATTLVVLAVTGGVDGNDIATTTTTAATWGDDTLTGGAIEQTTEWPRKAGTGQGLVMAQTLDTAGFCVTFGLEDSVSTLLVDPNGQEIVGIPVALQRACSEYAFRALTIPLFQDAPAPVGGRLINSSAVRVDVISQHTIFTSPQSGAFALPAFPAADLLLSRAGLIASGVTLFR